MTELYEKARAKINLTLHVGAPTADGFHPLQSLVIFADIGDDLVLIRDNVHGPRLTLDGPFASDLGASDDNLVMRAAQLVGPIEKNGMFKLTKNLPVASGIGGGSADAAAAIRLLCQAENRSPKTYLSKSAELGSDIPVCIGSQTCLMSGRGERIKPLPGKGQIHAVLVNPGVSVSTGEIFGLFDETDHIDTDLAEPDCNMSLLEMARAGRNDLQNTAISLCPEIVNVLAAVESQSACQLARMSGSGATCFGLFPDQETAGQAARVMATQNPDWWCVPTVLGDQV